jgi:hypothetical protein
MVNAPSSRALIVTAVLIGAASTMALPTGKPPVAAAVSSTETQPHPIHHRHHHHHAVNSPETPEHARQPPVSPRDWMEIEDRSPKKSKKKKAKKVMSETPAETPGRREWLEIEDRSPKKSKKKKAKKVMSETPAETPGRREWLDFELSQRDLENIEEMDARDPGLLGGALRIGKGLFKAFGGNRQRRDLDDMEYLEELAARDPKGIGRFISSGIKHLASGYASSAAGGYRREFPEVQELEARKRPGSGGGGTFRALGAALHAHSQSQSQNQGRAFDDMEEVFERDFDDVEDVFEREYELEDLD